MNEETRKIFLQQPMVSFYSHEISEYLVRPNLCSLGSDRVNKCGRKWCEVCMNVSRLNKFTSNDTCETNNINHKLNYDDNCLIYLLSCKYCSKQSLESFVKKVACKSVALAFQQHERQCLLKNVTITLSNKTNGKELKKRQGWWRKTFKTYSSFGHNVDERIWALFIADLYSRSLLLLLLFFF